MLQLDFFIKDETELLQLEMRELKKSSDKVRRGIFARHGELAKMYCEIKDGQCDIERRLSIIERHICQKN